MRNLLLTALTILPLALPVPAAAQDNAARPIIEKAVQAQGGLETLTKADAGSRKVKGVFVSDNFKFIGDSFSDHGNRLRITLRGTEASGEVRILVMVGTKGWLSFNGAVFEFDDQDRARMRRAAHADKVAGLIVLLREQGFTLSVLGDSTVGETAVVGVLVRYEGMPEMQLYFDKATGFLVKTRYPVIESGAPGEIMQEVYYSNFELFDPAAEPLKILQEAKLDTANPALLKFLADRVPDKETRAKMQLLVLELGRSSYAARQRASAALQEFGPKAAFSLREATRSDDREVERRAKQLLELLAQSHEPDQAAGVVRLLAVRRPAGTAEALLAYYPWACNAAVDKEVLYALTTLADVDPSARGAIEAALKDADPIVRAAAQKVLGKDGGQFLKEPGRRVVLEGVRFARSARIFRAGQLHFEMETFEHQFFNHFDDSLFARP